MHRKPYFVLSPCGTSLFTNVVSNEERPLVAKYANTKSFDQIPEADAAVLSKILARANDKLAAADVAAVVRISAELNSIVRLYGSIIKGPQDVHVLLCTDTWLGNQSAELVKAWLEKHELQNVQVRRQTDLQTASLQAFQCALSGLVEWCEETVTGYQLANYHVVFNLTGGFKSVQGFLQTLAMFYADETIYVFETGNELLRIPRLPIKMDFEATILGHLNVFRRLSQGLKVTDSEHIPETLLMQLDGDLTLSAWGDLVWKRSKKDIYEKTLHPSPSEKIVFSPQFEKSIENLPTDRLLLINERIDQLARYLEIDRPQGRPSLRGLDFKDVQRNPKPPSTHELDAWSDKDARRIFGHFEGPVFHLDKLDKGLH
ncbi:MAG: putative CRISPR-associated protein [Acidobacteria bacterium]|nr:putative CRISPR-associated protein [Acidobacteriota bacterium]